MVISVACVTAGWASPALAQDAAVQAKPAKPRAAAQRPNPAPRPAATASEGLAKAGTPATASSAMPNKPAIQLVPISTSCGLPRGRAPLAVSVDVMRHDFDNWHVPFRGAIGVRAQPLSARRRVALGAPPTAGIRVFSTQEGSVAAKAGVRPGDVLIDVGGKPIRRSRDARKILRQANVGEVLTIQVIRAGQPKTLFLRLGKTTPKSAASAAHPDACQACVPVSPTRPSRRASVHAFSRSSAGSMRSGWSVRATSTVRPERR